MDLCNKQRIARAIISLCFTLLLAKQVLAIPFGIYEPRSMAMGGAGVAAAGSENAVFYNPAILATYKDYKEKATNEAFSFPVLSIRASRALETLAEQSDVNYEQDINNSVSNYNNNQNVANAQAVLDSINPLYNTLAKVANKVFLLDANASLVVGVPSKYQGGAFYVSHRGVGDGQVNVSSDDLQLLNDYQEELDAVAAGNAPGSVHPELYSGGQLNDPSARITSEANARAVVISELGISMSRQINIMGSAFSFGVTPKMMQVTTYDFHRSINNNREEREDTKDEDWQPNVDLGLMKTLGKQWRFGLVVKNLIERDYPTSSGQEVTFKPQWRAGAAYITERVTYTVDMDLQANEGVYPGNAAQFILAGLEFRQGLMRYRLGYRDSVSHKGPKQAGILSAGFGFYFGSLYLDMAYSENQQQRAASLMLGFNF